MGEVRIKKNYKVTNVETGKVLVRYGTASKVVEVTGMYPTNIPIYVNTGALYKKIFLVEFDYESALDEEWEQVRGWFLKLRKGDK